MISASSDTASLSPLPMYMSPVGVKFGFRLVDDLHDLFRPLTEQHPVPCERDMVTAAHEEFPSEIVFQVLQLPGQCRLSDVQTVRRIRDASRSRHSQKVFQHSEFHLVSFAVR